MQKSVSKRFRRPNIEVEVGIDLGIWGLGFIVGADGLILTVGCFHLLVG